MRVLWLRADVRTAAYAAIFAIWCVAWVFGAFESTRPLPGLMSLQGTGGAYELLRWFIGQPPWLVAVGFAVTAFLVAWLPLKLLHWLDREGEARAALRWALSSGSLNLLVFAMPAVLIAVGLAVAPRIEEWLVALIGAVVIVPLIWLMPFLAFNPATLRPARLVYWWRAMWPGWRPVVAALLLTGVLSGLTGFASDAVADNGPWFAWVGIGLLAYGIDSVAEIIAAVLWLSRDRCNDTRDGLAQIANLRFLRAYVGLDLVIGLLALPFVVPILVCSVYFVHVTPHYEIWAQQTGMPLPWSMQIFSKLKPLHSLGAWLPLGLPATALSLLCLGRLLVRHGIGGSESDTPSR
jgi:hypothetical protein